MVNIGFGIKLSQKNKTITKLILTEFRKELKKAFPMILSQIEIDVKDLIRVAIQSSSAYIDLLGGSLQGELGVPDTSTRLPALIDLYVNSIVVKLMPITLTTRTLKGSIVIKFDQTFANLLTSPEAAYLTDKGEVIPWLEWLLIEGDLTITEYTFSTSPQAVVDIYSRTGLGLMFRTRGGRWSVPTEFAGTIGDNFITRAIRSVRKEINTLFKKSLKNG